jgi:phage baseplate assembly protein W
MTTRLSNPYSGLRFAHPDFQSENGESGLTVSTTGRLGLVSGRAAIRQSISLLLSTIPGERLRRPGYGCPLHELVFAPNDDTTHGIAMHYIEQAIRNWERRVEIVKIDAKRDDIHAQIMQATLHYRIKKTGEDDNLTFALDLYSSER